MLFDYPVVEFVTSPMCNSGSSWTAEGVEGNWNFMRAYSTTFLDTAPSLFKGDGVSILSPI